VNRPIDENRQGVAVADNPTTTMTSTDGSFLRGAFLALLTLGFFTVAVGGLFARQLDDERVSATVSHAAPSAR
jgi:hypothetical protein